jgi:hypothetical protein
MAVPKSLAQMVADSTWQPWVEQGWTLHQAPGGWVVAVNLGRRMATARAQRLSTVVKRLERGAFGYKRFLVFKRIHTR